MHVCWDLISAGARAHRHDLRRGAFFDQMETSKESVSDGQLKGHMDNRGRMVLID
jgi:hypothetical protein